MDSLSTKSKNKKARDQSAAAGSVLCPTSMPALTDLAGNMSRYSGKLLFPEQQPQRAPTEVIGEELRLARQHRREETDRAALHQLLVAPAIFQALIEGPIDVRATIVGQEIYAAAIRTERSRAGLDSRLDLDVPTTPYEIQGDVARQLHALMTALGLTFATIDLKIDKAGQLHFLELNPQGQFLYIEILTGLPIAASLARLLVNAQRGEVQGA